MKAVLLSATLILTIAYGIVYETHPQEPSGPHRDYYNGRYWTYYETYGLGPLYANGVATLDPTQDLSKFTMPDAIPVYMFRSPWMHGRSDADAYLGNFNFNVSGYSYEYEYQYPYRTAYHTYSKAGSYIGMELDGHFAVGYGVVRTDGPHTNITPEEALGIAYSFAKNHTGVPTNSIVNISISGHHRVGPGEINFTVIDEFIIRFSGLVDGIEMGRMQQISIYIEALDGRVQSFEYSWPIAERIAIIEGDRLVNLTQVLTEYRTEMNNLQGGTDDIHVITSVSIVYHSPYGYKDRFEGTPYYLCLPYIQIEYGDGLGRMSPLADDAT